MAQISFDQISNSFNSTNDNQQQNKIGYFSLKEDGEEAVVRIMQDSTADFEILTTHPITINGKFLKANCLRDAREPLDNCPFCKAGEKVQQRMFVKLIQYTTENGQVVATPKIWDRPVSFATELKSKLDMYGPLSEQLFVIKKHVPHTGNLQQDRLKTTYSVDYAPTMVYPYQNYPKLTDAFTGYSVLGTAVVSKSKEDYEYYIQNGSFPQKGTNNGQAATAQPMQQVAPNYGATQASYQPAPNQTIYATGQATPPWEDAGVPFATEQPQSYQQEQPIQRPVRYY